MEPEAAKQADQTPAAPAPETAPPAAEPAQAALALPAPEPAVSQLMPATLSYASPPAEDSALQLSPSDQRLCNFGGRIVAGMVLLLLIATLIGMGWVLYLALRWYLPHLFNADLW